jgi:hypothetical protein
VWQSLIRALKNNKERKGEEKMEKMKLGKEGQ